MGHEDTLFLNERGSKLSRVMIFIIIKKLKTLQELVRKLTSHIETFICNSFITKRRRFNNNSKMMGHESITTTERYLHVDKKHLIRSL